MANETIQGTIDRVIFFNKENCYAVLSIKDKQKNFVAVGVIPDAHFGNAIEKLKDSPCKISGVWKKHKNFGLQFAFDKITIESGTLFFFLTKIVSGIGAKLAQALISYYGESELENILNNDPYQLTSFKGIKEKKAKKIANSWEEYKHLKILSDFFVQNNANISPSLLIKIYKHFKEKEEDNFIEKIKTNPYILTEVTGIGFKTCDKIALQIGLAEDSFERITALIFYIFQKEAENGHTYLTFQQIRQKVFEYIQIDTEKEKTILDKIKEIIQTDYEVIEDKIFLKGYLYQEQKILEFVKSKAESKSRYAFNSEKEFFNFIEQKEKEIGFKLSTEQIKAIKNITQNKMIYALCGYAGTGKSTISKIILDFYTQFIPKEKITCCAFTGMASKRIKDTTGYQSYTIHSLLKFNGKEFEFNEDKKLPYKVILLDEASMVNLSLFYALIKAIAPETVIILVGDNAQLPPIGAGNVFSDLLRYDFLPKTFLTKIFRQSEDSVLTLFANEIREGNIPKKYNNANYKDFLFIKKEISNYWVLKKKLSEKELKQKRDEFYQGLQENLLNKITEIVKNKKLKQFQAIWDIQVITPMKNTPLGTFILNNKIQAILNNNPVVTDYKGISLKKFDKVIHLKNENMTVISSKNYKEYKGIYGDNLELILEKAEVSEDLYKKRIFNGNLGIILDIDVDNELFTVNYIDDLKGGIVVFYSFDDLKNLIDLGYALTIHKVQGNQFKYVFIPLINAFYIMLNTKLLYTAITRAINKVYIIGQKYAFEHGCKNIEETIRQTYLSLK